MHLDRLYSLIPLERYRGIIAALRPERSSWLDDFWLRVAAQVAVLSPDDPQHLAIRIRDLGGKLALHAKWYQDLASPLRFVVAAMLVQNHIKFGRFINEHVRIAELLHRVGLRSHGFYHTMTVLILMSAPDSAGCGLPEAERLKAIHQSMKRYHWWLTGVDDLPACAALAQCRGSAIEVVARAEACYQLLHESGLSRGDHLQTAANLLPLTGLDADAAVARYRALRNRLEAHEVRLLPSHYEVLSLLSLLDHDPDLVIGRLLTMRKELTLFQPEVQPTANLIIAADLTGFDLVRYDRAQQPLTGTAAEPQMLHSLHLFRQAAAAMLSWNVDNLALPPVGVDPNNWPV